MAYLAYVTERAELYRKYGADGSRYIWIHVFVPRNMRSKAHAWMDFFVEDGRRCLGG